MAEPGIIRLPGVTSAMGLGALLGVLVLVILRAAG